MIITTLDTFTSLLAGITIFAILGNLAHNLNIDNIGDVVKSGSGLAFISYPDAIAKFDVVPQVSVCPKKKRNYIQPLAIHRSIRFSRCSSSS